jgi:hypothetical protein
MSTIFGVLGINDRDATLNTVGQAQVFDLINQYAAATQTELDKIYGVFVESQTTLHTERYFLPGGGMLQAGTNRTRPGAVKPAGSWDVAYPIDQGDAQLGWDRISYAYMSAGQADAQVKGVMEQYKNWKRNLILTALLHGATRSYTDQLYGSLTIQPLAIGSTDNVLYPPLIGSSSEATATHYVGSNYAASSISDTNNPFRDIVKAKLRKRFGNGRIVAWINSAQTAKVQALTSFATIVPQYVNVGANTATATADGVSGPGNFIGATDNVAVFEWDWIPDGYIFALDLDQPAPLKQRVDVPANLRGFQMVATQQEYPLQESFWQAREGYGVGNRLNGVAIQLVASTSYTAPSGY